MCLNQAYGGGAATLWQEKQSERAGCGMMSNNVAYNHSEFMRRHLAVPLTDELLNRQKQTTPDYDHLYACTSRN